MPESEEVLSRPAPAPDRVLRYGPGPERVVDVRFPVAEGPHPVVVVIHGGFWKARYDRVHTGPMCAALADEGYLVAAIEYHRVGQAEGGWPGTLDDVAAAVDALPGLLGEAADPERVVLLGHSAGGHLAMWAAGRHRLPEANPWYRKRRPEVRGVVALAGVLDLALAAAEHLGDGAVAGLLGGQPDTHWERYAAADPTRLVPTGVRSVLVQGAADSIVPPQVSRSFAAAAVAAGDHADLRELPGQGHFELIDPLSAAWPEVLKALAELTG
ncbi:acetyl esterase/lipase [Crossiella equi]|uniref:Acetyl esterase/lipase n=1 Tax=Crossiella equi TaxID=130796 RepID=A0ABS5ABD7_9PSEU|nr:alpha/beta hydrolase [Crossiella equi]MBP2473005.1 acetyl esterase/lipase [Crossiella equi]